MEATLKLVVKSILILSGDEKYQLFSLQKALLNLVGLDFFQNGPQIRMIPHFVKHKIYPLMFPMWMISIAILVLKHVSSNQPLTQFEFIKQINGIIVSMTFFAASFKFFIFFIFGKSFKELFIETEQLGVIHADNVKLQFHIKTCVGYTTLVASNLGTWVAWFYLKHDDEPFDAAYPWEDKGFGRLLTYFFGFFAATFCAICHTLVDTAFQMMVAGIIIHIDSVAEKLSLVGSGKIKDRHAMSEIYEKHVKLLRVANNFSRGYSNLFVAQSVYTVGHSCVLLFGAAHVDDRVEIAMSQGTMLMTSYMQLLIYCYYGELLTSKFSGLLFDSYNNEWYECDMAVKKDLGRFALMCHKHISLRGFGNVHPSKSNWLHVS
uniref:Odorant receptor n=1 Tax=Cyrtorhinus lividipennis TaxID=1032904 RepID=A0A346TI13_9HEMI|nr:odorant receptor 5 [Cyrtorhinus lividipennis]